MSKEKIDRGEWKKLLGEAFSKSATVKFVDGVNPCLVELNGVRFWIYQKNITSTAFNSESETSDVCRIQLPRRDIFQPIKDSDIAFIFLGYDRDNDVYVTWNPYTTKQRLNVTQNVSFYSRRSAQNLAAETGDFQSSYQSNGSKLLAFQRMKLADFLLNVAEYFPEMQEYVAVGSKRRKEANETYRNFVNRKNIEHFLGYLRTDPEVCSMNDVDSLLYFQTIRALIDGVVTPNLVCRKLFLKYDSICDYPKALVPLMNTEEVYLMDTKLLDCLEPALVLYVSFLNKISGSDNKDNFAEQLLGNDEDSIEEDTAEEGSDIDGNPINIDPDQRNIKNGKLLRIANPTVLEQIRPLLDTEYAKRAEAINIIIDYYQDRCPNMEFKDWKNLIDGIDWSNPLPTESSRNEPESYKKQYVIALILPDGGYIMYKNVARTFVEAREKIGIEYFMIEGLPINEIPATTLRKVNVLFYVIDKQNLDYKLAVVPLNMVDESNIDFTPYLVKEPFEEKSILAKRDKIRITFADGTFIQQKQVVSTFLYAIQLAGANNVLNLGLMQGKRPFVLTELSEEEKSMTRYKEIGEGLWINTNSDTQFKYDILEKINSKLHLQWVIEKV